ncbi:membrane protein [Intrasporangium oryzae NRRL B-24470]|uniref:Membrane protein n=1 Tax=Intrasporangium oryzae NRRL B-24470 TaxID=1386089 RepID=W9G4D7_9MICO|nr:PrsW family intramembrane metalloprotease [Intrasporangium oryzae]EWT00986.1 membrane protein [Intrasporangium oryzae NRRL B-24470]
MTPGDVTTSDPSGQGSRSVGTEPRWHAPNPTRRPALRTTLTIGVATSVFLLCLLVVVGIFGERLTAATIITSALMAILPLFVVVPVYLWLDRFEAEPTRYRVFAFLWGALVAVVGAFFLNTFGLRLLVDAQWTDPLETGAVYLAPITEETLKGLGVLLIYLLRRREFDGIVDGIVYGGLIGAGFAFSENILYLGQAYSTAGSEGLTATFIVRCIMGPFGHPLFTSITGIGIGIAVTTRNPATRVLAIVTGWVCAMILHSLWNLSALAGIDGFIQAYVTYQVPLFVAFLGFLVWVRRREGRLIGQYLSPYADAGWLTHGEVTMLSHMRMRRDARAWAKSHGGTPAKRSMAAFQDSASDLALLRSRLVHGTAEPGASERELELLDAITTHRRNFIGSPMA